MTVSPHPKQRAEQPSEQPAGRPGEVKIRYADSAESMTVAVLHTWIREDVPAPIMSISSGPKDYTVNAVYTVFEANPDAVRIALVRGSGPMFFLIHDGRRQQWHDITGRQVVTI